MSRLRFEGKVVVVSGGSMGIGRATVLRFAHEGAHVITCARRQSRLDTLLDDAAACAGTVSGVVLDVADAQAYSELIDSTARQHGRLDALVNNAPSVIGGMVVEQPLADWQANFRVGVDSVFTGTQAALRIMQHQGFGAVVNISSVSGLRASLSSAAYGAAKAAVNQFSQCAAMELAGSGVRVNVVAPGAVDTPGFAVAIQEDAAARQAITDAIPMRRASTPDEVASAICFLASDEASSITAVVLPVDGGKSAQLYVPAFDVSNMDNRALD